MLDLLTRPELLKSAKTYFTDVQTKEVKDTPLLCAHDKPAIWLNKATMERFRPQMVKFYYDASKYSNYMEQLGINIRRSGPVRRMSPPSRRGRAKVKTEVSQRRW